MDPSFTYGNTLMFPYSTPASRIPTINQPATLTSFKTTKFIGSGNFSGIVKLVTVPVQNRVVRLYDRETGLILAETQSAVDGAYEFNGFEINRKYYLVGLDTLSSGATAGIVDFQSPVAE